MVIVQVINHVTVRPVLITWQIGHWVEHLTEDSEDLVRILIRPYFFFFIFTFCAVPTLGTERVNVASCKGNKPGGDF